MFDNCHIVRLIDGKVLFLLIQLIPPMYIKKGANRLLSLSVFVISLFHVVSVLP